MNRIAIILVASVTATAAYAHPGHIAAEEGHSHWLVAACAVAAIAIGVAGWALNRRAAARRAR